MRKLFNYVVQMGLSGFSNVLLSVVATSIVVTSITLISLYVVEHAKESEAMKTLQCASGLVSRPDCPDRDSERKIASLEEKIAKMRQKLANLERIEENVDTITLFETRDVGGKRMTIGSVYNAITDGDNGFKSHFCYISLQGNGSFTRDLYIRNSSGDVELDATTLREAGISSSDMSDARSKCKPMLIGGSA